jgi:hypothetical protein
VRSLLGRQPELELRGVLGPRTPARGAGIFSTIEALLAGARPDVAVIGGPPGRFVDAALQLLAVGVDLLVEPPVSTDPADAERLESLAERLGRAYRTAAPMRHARALHLAREAMERGLLGGLQGMELNLVPKPGCEPHALDAAELLAGPIERVRMFEERALFTEHRAGRVHSRILLALDPGKPPVRCVGERGSLEVGHTAVLLERDGERRRLGPGLCEWEARQRTLDEFLRARTERNPELDHGAQSLQWLAAARRSLSRARWEYA